MYLIVGNDLVTNSLQVTAPPLRLATLHVATESVYKGMKFVMALMTVETIVMRSRIAVSSVFCTKFMLLLNYSIN